MFAGNAFLFPAFHCVEVIPLFVCDDNAPVCQLAAEPIIIIFVIRQDAHAITMEESIPAVYVSELAVFSQVGVNPQIESPRHQVKAVHSQWTLIDMPGTAVIQHSDPQHLNLPEFQNLRFHVIRLGRFQVDVGCISGIVSYGDNVVRHESHVPASSELYPYVPAPVHDAGPVVVEPHGGQVTFHVKNSAVLRLGCDGLSQS